MTEDNVCKYCKKTFRKLSTLTAHLCEPKRRWQQEKDTGVQLGFRAYLRFYEMSQGSAKLKTYADFVESPYYSAFVKFGQYLVQIRAINVAAFTEYVIRENKKLDQWTRDHIYEDYLYDYLRREHPTDALERSLLEMQRWADERNENFADAFRKGAPNLICLMVRNGRISPWVLYNCSSGIDFISRLNEEQLVSIYKYIDAGYWQRKFKDYVADTEYLKEALKMAGL